MNRKLVVALSTRASVVALTTAAVMSPSRGHAKGCIKGAVVGGLAGHLVHHGVSGAVAGCVIGHHAAAKQRREREQRNDGAARGEGKR
jgi:outer membrane lipoprotein SlyB